MFDVTINTSKYDIDVGQLITRRLAVYPNSFSVLPTENGAYAAVDGMDALPVCAAALATLICRDLIYFELARMADTLPLNLAEKQSVLTETLKSARGRVLEGRVGEGITAYLTERQELNLEGYVQFRMQQELAEWRMLIERAAQEQLMCREYTELLSVLNTFVQLQQPRVGEISVCINPDGSCTLTDDSDARIEYVDCSEDGIVGLLVSMAPSRLIVYDLSGGNGRRLADAIAHVFSGRVRIYR